MRSFTPSRTLGCVLTRKNACAPCASLVCVSATVLGHRPVSPQHICRLHSNVAQLSGGPCTSKAAASCPGVAFLTRGLVSRVCCSI